MEYIIGFVQKDVHVILDKLWETYLRIKYRFY